MITSVDKFLVAAIGAAIFALTNWLGFDFDIGQDWINSLTAVLTPVLVWVVPNREA